MFGKIVNLALLVLAGIVFAALGTVAHQSSSAMLGISLPWGLALALLAVAALLVGLRLVNETRAAAFAAAIGVVGTISVLSLRSVGGSVLVQNNVAGVTWVIAPIVIAMVVIGWPKTSGRRPATHGRPGGPLKPPETTTLPA